MKKFIFFQILAALVSNTSFSNSAKIDSNGKYINFPGITVIAHPQEEDFNLLKSLYIKLIESPTITNSYAPLPLNSYHMTTVNLFTKVSDSSGSWESFIDEHLPWLEVLYHYTSEHPILAEGKVVGLKMGGTIGLVIELKAEDKSNIVDFAKKFEISNKIPPQFHVTLGYAYKEISEVERARIKKTLRELAKDLIGKPIRFENHRLTYFNDMTAFFPWDAKTNPFSGTTTQLISKKKTKSLKLTRKARL